MLHLFNSGCQESHSYSLFVPILAIFVHRGMNPHRPKIRVLCGCRPYIRLLRGYKSEYFRRKNNHILFSTFCAFVTTLMCIAIPIYMLLGVWSLIETSADMKVLVAQLPLQFSLLQMQLTYIGTITKQREITDTIKKLQGIITQREYPWFIGENLRIQWNRQLGSFFDKGSSESEESFTLYKNVERKHAFASSILLKASSGSILGLCFLSAMLPIAYLIFGYPTPDLWAMPLQTQ